MSTLEHSRFEWIAVVVCLVGFIGCSSSPPRYNVLLITLDTLRRERLGTYGHYRDTSPTIDGLAAVSLVFDHAIAQSAVTPVSHASIMTGLNPYNHGLRSLHGGVGHVLPGDRLTLAELLSSNGYTTGAFVGAFPTTRYFGLDQGFETWDQEFKTQGAVTGGGYVNTEDTQRRADETTNRALAWLAKQAERPFFAWIHYFDVHDGVLLPPEEYRTKFLPESPSDVDKALGIYDGEIAFIDAQVARLLAELERLGKRDDTIVALVADHGEGLGDHDWWGHGILYQEQVRVPFILSLPEMHRGRRVHSVVRTIDLVPTLVVLLGLEIPPGTRFDGENLLGPLHPSGDATRIAYSESINDLIAYHDSPFHDESLYAINDGRWKLIAHYTGTAYTQFELFDLETDPGEMDNVYDRYPDQVAPLLAQLEGFGAILENPPRPSMDAELMDRLRALGYVK
jgi:arylsulfatase A-like enzyme